MLNLYTMQANKGSAGFWIIPKIVSRECSCNWVYFFDAYLRKNTFYENNSQKSKIVNKIILLHSMTSFEV